MKISPDDGPKFQSAQILPSSRVAVAALVTHKEEVSPRHFLFTLQAPAIAAQAQAGQFVHILPRDATSSDPFLRRAFSILEVQGDTFSFLFRVEGRGTRQISLTNGGEPLDVLGPLGQPFDLAPFHVKQSGAPVAPGAPVASSAPVAVLVGGGIGVPPLVFLAQRFHSLGLEPIALIGARSQAEIVGEAHFQLLGIEPRFCTDDGSRGARGFVTQTLETALAQLKAARKTPVVYACGPTPMLRAVAAVAARHEARCQVSLEENMPCGIGVCNGCVVAMRGAFSDYERYRRVCIHGPALWADEIDWEAP